MYNGNISAIKPGIGIQPVGVGYSDTKASTQTPALQQVVSCLGVLTNENDNIISRLDKLIARLRPEPTDGSKDVSHSLIDTVTYGIVADLNMLHQNTLWFQEMLRSKLDKLEELI